MSQKIYGDLDVKRTLTAEVRADKGLRVATITGAETLTINSYSWQKLLNNTASENVILPDATTIPIKGFSQIIENPAASTYNLVVKDGGASPTILKTLIPGTAYEFTCEDLGTDNGVWFVTELGDTSQFVATRYSQIFNATSDWTAGVITITGATHKRGVNPVVTVYETSGTSESKVELDIAYDNTTGNVTLTVPSVATPDCRFAGRVLIM